jgi:hypothetical protein
MDVRGEIYDPENFQYSGEISKPDNIQSDSGRGSLLRLTSGDDRVRESNQIFKLLESLILAQDERWRRA